MARTNNHEGADECIEAHRDIVRQSLDEVATHVEAALQNAGLQSRVYLVAPNTGSAIIQVATLLDPPEADWEKASAIVCQCISDRLGGVKLGMRPLQCAVANPKLHAAELEVIDNLSS